MTKLPIIDLFTSIQGEGKYAGTPSIFIRTSGCNLRCVFGNSICDTPYSSFKPEQSGFTFEDVLAEMNKNPNVKHIVITGGEPTIHQDALVEMLDFLRDNHEDFWTYFITIETNGSVDVTNDELTEYVDLWSISPKLSTAVAKPHQEVNTPDGVVVFTDEQVKEFHNKRTNIPNMTNLIMNGADVQLKFVYSGQESYDEIKDMVKKINDLILMQLGEEADDFMVNTTNYVMLMPEGMTEDVLSMHRREAADICVKEGWSYTDRLHITIWGDKRGF